VQRTSTSAASRNAGHVTCLAHVQAPPATTRTQEDNADTLVLTIHLWAPVVGGLPGLWRGHLAAKPSTCVRRLKSGLTGAPSAGSGKDPRRRPSAAVAVAAQATQPGRIWVLAFNAGPDAGSHG